MLAYPRTCIFPVLLLCVSTIGIVGCSQEHIPDRASARSHVKPLNCRQQFMHGRGFDSEITFSSNALTEDNAEGMPHIELPERFLEARIEAMRIVEDKLEIDFIVVNVSADPILLYIQPQNIEGHIFVNEATVAVIELRLEDVAQYYIPPHLVILEGSREDIPSIQYSMRVLCDIDVSDENLHLVQMSTDAWPRILPRTKILVMAHFVYHPIDEEFSFSSLRWRSQIIDIDAP